MPAPTYDQPASEQYVKPYGSGDALGVYQAAFNSPNSYGGVGVPSDVVKKAHSIMGDNLWGGIQGYLENVSANPSSFQFGPGFAWGTNLDANDPLGFLRENAIGGQKTWAQHDFTNKMLQSIMSPEQYAQLSGLQNTAGQSTEGVNVANKPSGGLLSGEIPWQVAVMLGLMGAGAGGWLGAAGAPGGAAGGGAVGSGLGGAAGGTGLGGAYASAGGAMDMGAGFGGGTAEALGLGGAGGTGIGEEALYGNLFQRAALENTMPQLGYGQGASAQGERLLSSLGQTLSGGAGAALQAPQSIPQGQPMQTPGQAPAQTPGQGTPTQAPQAAGSNASKAMGLPGQPPSATAPGAAQPPAGITGNAFIDDIIGQFKKNALQIGLGVGSMMMAGGQADEMNPAMQQLSTSGQNAQNIGNEYIAAAQAGRLTGPQQASMDQYVQRAKNQIRQYFAGINQFDSTARIQAEQLIDQEALAMQNNLIQTTLDQGLKALQVGQGPIQQVAQYQAGQDQALIQAMGNFAGGLGNLFGRGASQGQVTQNTAVPTIQGQ